MKRFVMVSLPLNFVEMTNPKLTKYESYPNYCIISFIPLQLKGFKEGQLEYESV